MMKILVFSMTLVLLGTSVQADTLVAARTIRSKAIVGPEDVYIKDIDTPGAYTALDDVVGMEARVALYAGRPIRSGDVGPPALVDRNQIVALTYIKGGLSISVEARALGRGGAGDVVRVMNLASRSTVSGVVQSDGSIVVKN
jgi:flagella basal body P-ring formation protein FlgA